MKESSVERMDLLGWYKLLLDSEAQRREYI